jgi:hypothetical protein
MIREAVMPTPRRQRGSTAAAASPGPTAPSAARSGPVEVRRLTAPANPAVSLCAMVTRWEQYEVCRASLLAHGFAEEDCEFLVIDNSEGNVADAYQATNAFLQAARAPYIVLHHQDVRLLEQGRLDLEQRLQRLTDLDPDWALCGNAGAATGGRTVLHLSHPVNDRHVEGGPFPARVMSLDENFIVVRREANLAVSHDLRGFHHYGVDLCMVAELLGWHAYVIDFLLRHDSPGTMDESYWSSRRAIAAKYRSAFRPRWIELVTHQPFYASSSRAQSELAHLMRAVRQVLHAVRDQHRLPSRSRSWRP